MGVDVMYMFLGKETIRDAHMETFVRVQLDTDNSSNLTGFNDFRGKVSKYHGKVSIPASCDDISWYDMSVS
jgi:hypothetical protein